MKLQICAEIEGLFLLKNQVTAKLYPYEFNIFEKEGKRFISITKPVSDYMKYVPKLHMKAGIPHIEVTSPEIYKDMEEWLYYIEAMGAFNFEVSKIHINELEVTWICESEEEKCLIPIISLKRNKKKYKADKYILNSNLSNLVVFRRMLPEAHIPFTYYRQAKIFFNSDNYYFAFINYFMMLEFCFAEGNFKQKQVESCFLKSNLLKLCVLSAISTIKGTDNNDAEYYKWLLKENQIRQKNISFESIVYLLIYYRGLLSHASNQSKKYLFDDYKLRPLTFITSVICFYLCGYIQIYSCSSEDSKMALMNERINELEKKLKLTNSQEKSFGI